MNSSFIPPAMRIVESILMVEPYEDWSQVRSPGRARRRLKQGHLQRITHTMRPKKEALHLVAENMLVMHPVMARALREATTTPAAPPSDQDARS